MIFDFPNAPMHYLEGIPAYKAGEWNGLKSCKFMPTRKIINPKSHGIIFNDNNNLQPKRKTFSQPPSREYVFKPSIKMVDITSHNVTKIVNPTFESRKERPEKLHYFKYKAEHIKELNEKEKNNNSKKALDDEFKLLNNLGIKKTQDMSNYALLNLTKKNDYNSQYQRISNLNHINRPEENSWNKKEDKQENFKIGKETVKVDSDYVRTLDNWDKKFLPKIGNK